MSDGRKIAAESKEIVFVQLSKLKKSPRTCGGFRTPRPRLSRLRQASARSACFNRRLSPRSGRATNRPATIWSLGGTPACAVAPRKRKGIKGDEPIRCVLGAEHSRTEISLAENAIRTNMHPADRYEAFAKLQREWH